MHYINIIVKIFEIEAVIIQDLNSIVSIQDGIIGSNNSLSAQMIQGKKKANSLKNFIDSNLSIGNSSS